MRKLLVFNSVSADGYFTDKNSDMSWAHKNDPEWDEFVAENSQSGGELLFGRVTYEMMASHWPTKEAHDTMPVVADAMNNLKKIVFSKTMKEASWKNTTLLKGDPVTEMRRLKGEAGEDMVIMGSGTIVSQLAQDGLIDEYQFIVIPVALGKGRTLFEE